MMDPKEKIVVAFKAMGRGEQQDVMRELMAVMLPDMDFGEAKDDGVEMMEAIEVEAKTPRRKGRGLYWLKRVTGWDDSQKKGFRLEGEFVKPSEAKEGEVLAMGMTTISGKRYGRVRAEKGASFQFVGPDDVGLVKVEGVVLVQDYVDWESFEKDMRGT